MPFDPKELAGYQAVEEQAAAKFTDLPVGMYQFAVSKENSEVLDMNGLPVLRLSNTVMGGAQDGRAHSAFLRWFASENSESEQSFEDRQSFTREMTRRFFLDIVDSIAGFPDGDAELATEIIGAVTALGDTDETDVVVEMFTALTEILDGVGYIGRIAVKKNKKTKTEFTTLYPTEYEKGIKHIETDLEAVAV